MKAKTIIGVVVILFLLSSIIRCVSSGKVDDVDAATNTETVSKTKLSDAEIQNQQAKAESDRILAEAQAEYDANNGVKPTYTDTPSQSTVNKSQSQPMDFSACKELQRKTMIDVLPYKSFIVLNNQSISTIKLCTNDGAVLMSCSAADSSMITTETNNMQGCN